MAVHVLEGGDQGQENLRGRRRERGRENETMDGERLRVVARSDLRVKREQEGTNSAKEALCQQCTGLGTVNAFQMNIHASLRFPPPHHGHHAILTRASLILTLPFPSSPPLTLVTTLSSLIRPPRLFSASNRSPPSAHSCTITKLWASSKWPKYRMMWGCLGGGRGGVAEVGFVEGGRSGVRDSCLSLGRNLVLQYCAVCDSLNDTTH